jgi:hypothetical protein
VHLPAIVIIAIDVEYFLALHTEDTAKYTFGETWGRMLAFGGSGFRRGSPTSSQHYDIVLGRDLVHDCCRAMCRREINVGYGCVFSRTLVKGAVLCWR